MPTNSHTFPILWLNRLLPNHCLLCQQHSKTAHCLCHYCHADLNYFDYGRLDNLLLRPDIFDGLINPKFDNLISLAPYQWPFSQWIGDLKFNERFALARLLATQLADLLAFLINQNPALKPDIVLPVPVHPYRRFCRGYNQAHLISQTICNQLDLAMDCHILKRHKSTKAQSSLTGKLRRDNVKDAFSYLGGNYRHIALIDDVITTGSTINEICRLLKKNKIEKISVWTVCATPKKAKSEK